jgi:hypothetical protein
MGTIAELSQNLIDATRALRGAPRGRWHPSLEECRSAAPAAVGCLARARFPLSLGRRVAVGRAPLHSRLFSRE